MARPSLENGKESRFIGVRLAPSMADRLDELADTNGTKRSTLIREALAAYLDAEAVPA